MRAVSSGAITFSLEFTDNLHMLMSCVRHTCMATLPLHACRPLHRCCWRSFTEDWPGCGQGVYSGQLKCEERACRAALMHPEWWQPSCLPSLGRLLV